MIWLLMLTNLVASDQILATNSGKVSVPQREAHQSSDQH
jgi:hypothetical protein